MRTATVRHQTNRNFIFMAIEADEIRMRDFERVAFVSIPDHLTDETEALEYVYTATNSLDVWWGAAGNQNVQALRERTRSTSTGDIISLDGDRFMVASIGFKKVN
jgi:hypothetical protein